MSCADRKITFRITRKQEHIFELLKYKYNLSTTNMCNKIINESIQKMINHYKEMSEHGYDYESSFAEKMSTILNQYVGVKREVLSFRLTKSNEDLIYQHVMFFDVSGDIKYTEKENINKVVSQLIYYYIDGQDIDELCDIAGICSDEIWTWIQEDRKAVKY